MRPHLFPYLVLVTFVVTFYGHAVAARQAPPPYLIGAGDCFVVVGAQRIPPTRSELLVLATDRTPFTLRVAEGRTWVGRADRGLRDGNNCNGRFPSSPDNLLGSPSETLSEPFTLVRVMPEGGEPPALSFGMPSAGMLAVGGRATVLGESESRSLAKTAASWLPAGWESNGALVRGYQYGPADGHTVVELYVGVPTLNVPGTSPPIKAIGITRVFLVDGRPAGFDEYERASGVEERVDTKPPQLTHDNWSRSETESTVAFVSRDRGRSWERLSTNVGFEGIHWSVHALRPGTTKLFDRYLYTPH